MNYQAILILLNLMSSLVYAGIPNSCFQQKTSISCDFYSECMEKQFQCGPDGYPIRYGLKYCERFKSLNTSSSFSSKNLSSKGVAWRNETLKCLQNVLIPSLTKVSLVSNCNAVNSFAFDSHVQCYTTPGASICDLSVSDWDVIRSVPDWEDSVFSVSGLNQIRKVIQTCARQVISELERLQAKQMRLHKANYDLTLDQTVFEKEKELYEKLEYIENLKRDFKQPREI